MRVQGIHWLDYDPVALAVLLIGLSIVELLVFVSAAPCANWFDGSWNVVLITQSGGCERSGQVAGQISRNLEKFVWCSREK